MAILTQLISPALQWLTCVARRAVLLNLALLAMLCPTQASEKIDVVALVTGSIDQTRGLSSFAEMSMLIKRPSWQRKSTLKAWTRGREDALIRFVAPTRDAGNALLKQGERCGPIRRSSTKAFGYPEG